MEHGDSLLHSPMPATCPYPEPAEARPCPQIPTSWRSFLILSSHLHLGLPSGLFPSGFPPKHCTQRISFPNMLHEPPHLIPLDLIIWTILGKEHRYLSSSLCSFLHSCYLVPLRPKYSPQHPILKHPQPMFLPQCQRPSFTSIQNNRQNYKVYSNN